MTAPDGSPPVAPDGFLGGLIQIHQLADGYRAGLDAALLASVLDLKPDQRAMEFGCGVGAALFGAAALYPQSRLVGVERDEAAATLALKNLALNGLKNRVRIVQADALDYRDERELDAVFFNPPFFDDPKALRAPKAGKHPAWISEQGLEAWVDAGLKRLRSGGVLTVIQRADRLDDVLASLKGRAGSVSVLAVHARSDEPAKRVLVQAIKTAKGPLQLLPPLIVHRDGQDGFTQTADAIFNGQLRLALRR